MSQEQGALFSEVLDYPDQVLLDLLLGNMQSSDVRVNNMITEIQKLNLS